MPAVLEVVSLLFLVTVIPPREEDLRVMVGLEYSAPVHVTINPVSLISLQSKLLNKTVDEELAELKVPEAKKFVMRELESMITEVPSKLFTSNP